MHGQFLLKINLETVQQLHLKVLLKKAKRKPDKTGVIQIFPSSSHEKMYIFVYKTHTYH